MQRNAGESSGDYSSLRTDEEGGYDCEFVEKSPRELQQECSVCLLTLKEPYLTSCCGYSFCRVCIGRVKDKDLPCPSCNSYDFAIFPNKGLQRSLSAFSVHCQYKKYGCNWSGELGKLEQHLNADIKTGESDNGLRLNGCAYVELSCQYKCGEWVWRSDLLDHEEHCHLRPQLCQYCRVYRSPFNEMHLHWETCDFFPVLCPNECTSVIFERRLLEQHLNEECPMLLVKCNICDRELPRQDMDRHSQEHYNLAFESNAIYYGYGHFENASLDSVLEKEIAIKEKLQGEIDKMKEESNEIRKEISTLESNCECEVSRLQGKLQLTVQQIQECQSKISQKESEINQINERNAEALERSNATLQKEMTLLEDEYRQKIKEAEKKKSDSVTEKLEVELELEKAKRRYDNQVKSLEVDMERKKTELAKKESEKCRREAIISDLQAKIYVEKERKEKEDLKAIQSKQIEELKRSNAQLKQQLKSYEEKPARLESKPTAQDYM